VSSARELRTALVLGGAGFLGRCVLEALCAEGVRAVSLDRAPRGRLRDLDVESLQADVAGGDHVLLDLLAEREFDLLVQAVGTGSVPRSLEHPLGDLGSNVTTTLTVLEALSGMPSPPLLVHASSAAVYGDSVRLPMDEDHPLVPVSPYGISKLAAEHYVRLYARLHGLPALSVRPFSLYGPGQRKLVVYDLLARIEAGEDPLVVRGHPEVTRDLVYAPDAARSLIALARRAPADGEPYNLSSGHGTALGDLVSALVAATGRSTEVRFTGDVRRGDPLRWEGDAGRSTALGAATSTTLEEGLARTIEWYRTAAAMQRPLLADD
jgi:UDP-glucose 4-epimerase